MSLGMLRRAMVAGIAFVVLFVAGVIVTFSDTPEIKSSDSAASAAQKWVTELSDSGHRVGLIIGAYILIIAAVAFVWFCNGLRESLELPPTLGRAVLALSVLGASAIGVASLVGGAGVAGAVEFGGNPLPSGDSIRPVAELFFPFLFVAFALVTACIIGTLSTCAGRAGTLPRWLVYGGWLGALGAIAGVFFFPFVLSLLWFLLVAIVRFTSAQSPASSSAD